MKHRRSCFAGTSRQKKGAGKKGWGGYSRQNNLRPLDDAEAKTGALYIRADLVERVKGEAK